MRAARVTEAGLTLCDVEEPEGDLPVGDVVAASICGTDFELVARRTQGFTLGHEMSVAVDGVVYAVEPTVRCGICEQCRAGFTQRCTGEHGNLGIFSDGGLADRVAVPPYALCRCPQGLDPLDACLVEPAAVAWHAVRSADVGPSERVAVVGGGSIGLLAASWFRSLGHAVDLEARHPIRRRMARDLGAGRPRASTTWWSMRRVGPRRWDGAPSSLSRAAVSSSSASTSTRYRYRVRCC